MLALAGRMISTRQPLSGGIALVHAEQVAREQRRLVATGTGPDFEDDIALIGRILGQQRHLDALIEVVDALIERRDFRFRHVDQFRIAALRHDVLQVVAFAGGGVKGPDRLHHRLEVRIFL